MSRIDKSQLDLLLDARVGIINFAATAASSNVATTAITTALSTAGDGGVSVPLQVASATQVGVITTGADNTAIIVNTITKAPIADGNNREVYGRITETGGVYTLSYFVLVNGTETAHTFGAAVNIDFYFAYRFDIARLPRNALIAIAARLIQQDPTAAGGGGGSTVRTPEVLNVTALNTISNLSNAPTAAGNVILYVNTKPEFAVGALPSFSVSGQAITWNAANAGYSVTTTMQVHAVVW